MTSTSPKPLGSPRKRRVEAAKNVILNILQDDVTCYSKELFTKASPQISSSWYTYKEALKLALPSLSQVQPATLVREKLLASSYRDYEHTFYYLKKTDRTKAKKTAVQKLLTYEKHHNLSVKIGDLLEVQAVAAINQEINAQATIRKLTNIFGVDLTTVRGKDQHIDIFVINENRHYGLELKNSLFPFMEWKEIYDHASNCAALSAVRKVKPLLLSRSIEAYTKTICNKRKTKYCQLPMTYYPEDEEETAREIREVFGFNFIEVVKKTPPDSLAKTIANIF